MSYGIWHLKGKCAIKLGFRFIQGPEKNKQVSVQSIDCLVDVSVACPMLYMLGMLSSDKHKEGVVVAAQSHRTNEPPMKFGENIGVAI